MARQDISLTPNDIVALTPEELAILDDLLRAGDRVGFYLTYYNMTGSNEAILQANIASFSGPIGGIAAGANMILQARFGGAENGASQYKGIYYLSQQVAVSAFAEIKRQVDTGQTGYLLDSEVFATAQSAWDRNNQSAQFPGSIVTWVEHALNLAPFNYEDAMVAIKNY